MATKKEIEFTSGVIDSPVDIRDYRIEVDTTQVFPEEFELPMVRIKNQGAVGSCVAHALSEVVEYYNNKQLGKTTEQSITYIYGNRRNSTHTGTGMVLRYALSNLLEWGDVSRAKCPGNYEVPDAINCFEAEAELLKELGSANRLTAYYRLYDSDEMKTALMNNGPIVFSTYWYSDMKVVDGVLTSEYKKEDKTGGHCMVIYGWNKDGWKVQNSWGKTWGVNGTCIIPYMAPLKEIWGVCDTIVEEDNGDLKKPFSTKIGEFFAKIFNWFLNLFKKNQK